MSIREPIRILIRSIAPPAVLIFILYKIYLKIKDLEWFQNTVITWKVIIKVLLNKDKQETEED